MLTSLVLEAVMLLKAILAILHKYYTAIMAKLDVIEARVDDVATTQAMQAQTLIDITLAMETLQESVDKILEAVVPSPAAGIRMLITMDGYLIKEGTLPMALTITATQKFLASVAFVDAKGNPAQVEGAPVFAVSDAAILSIAPTAAPNTVEVLAIGPVGTAQVKVEADADLGEGVKPVVGLLDVQVVAGEAVAVALTAGTPVEQ